MSRFPIYTIGYGARDGDAFINTLQNYQIDYLIDVRSRPYSSYKPEFSRRPLEEALTANNIRYVFMGDSLGGQPDDPACYDAGGKVDYDLCSSRPIYLAAIERLQKAQKQQLRVALMCSEGKPENCHRAKLIGETLTKQGVEVLHIDEKDNLIPHTQVMLRVIKGQPSLFGDEFFKHTSRKPYMKKEDDTGQETYGDDA